MGNPKSQRARTEFLTVRLRKAEREVVEEAADVRSAYSSEFVRNAALAEARRVLRAADQGSPAP